MIKYIAARLAAYVARNDESADYEIVLYGFDLILQETFIILAAMAIAIPLRIVPQVIVGWLSFLALRRYAGGTHAKHRAVCIVSSVLALFAPALVFSAPHRFLGAPILAGLVALDCCLLLLYAPADTEIRPVQTPIKRRDLKAKAVGVLLLLAVLAFALYRRSPHMASLVVTMATIVSVYTHPLLYWVYGCKKSTAGGIP